jgi:Transmembrane proteins 14C
MEKSVVKKSTCWTVLIYGAIMIILGILGYLSGSTISLIAGGASGALVIVSSCPLPFPFAIQSHINHSQPAWLS